MHTPRTSGDDVRPRRCTAISSREVAAELRGSDRPRVGGRRVAGESIDRRPRRRVCQTAGAQLWCAGASAGARVGARPSAAGWPLAQVVPAEALGEPAGGRARLGHGGGGDRRGARRRPHRPRARRRGDGRRWSGSRRRSATPMAEGARERHRLRSAQPCRMISPAFLRRPPIGWWDLARHPRRVGPDLRGPQADSRHARGADGARRLRARRAVLRLALAPPRDASTG